MKHLMLSLLMMNQDNPRSIQVRAVDKSYTITDLGKARLNVAINDYGQVVGTMGLLCPVNHAFLYSDGQVLDLGTLGSPSSSAAGINNYGQVVGVSALEQGDAHAFLYHGVTMTDLGTMNGFSLS